MSEAARRVLGEVAQIGLMALVATPLLNPVVWQFVFRFWPPACQAPDGSILLCLGSVDYTRPRDLTAIAISLALALAGAIALRLAIRRKRGVTA